MKNILLILMTLFLLTPQAHSLPSEGLKPLLENISMTQHGKNTELVVFWATWCSECRDKLANELPKLDESKDIAVLTINTDRNEGRAKAFVERTGLKLPVFRDSSRSLRKQLKVFSVPHWAVYPKREPNFHLGPCRLRPGIRMGTSE